MKGALLYSMKTKFVLVTALIVALFAAFLGRGMVRDEKAHQLEKLRENGKVLMTALKAPIINTMILGEMGIQPGLLDNFVEEIAGNPELATVYAFIVDDRGKVLAHNRSTEFGKMYADPLTRRALVDRGFRSQMVHLAADHVLDMALPLRVSGKCWGALRVGVSMAPLEAELADFETRVALRCALIFVVGTIVFSAVGHSITGPLVRLSQTMQEVKPGEFRTRPLPPRRDEIGMLQDSFADMLKRLDDSEKERERAREHLIQNEKMISIGKIVAGVAHEINNPLASIAACIYRLEGAVPPEARSCLEILKGSVPRMETIVRQLCDFSRAGSLDLQYVPSDLFFEEMQVFAELALKEYYTTLEAADRCAPPVMLQIDKGKLHQVVLNLVINACAASDYEGTVELSAAVEPGWYLLTVADGGHGISPQEREKIFDIFYTTKPAGEGSGIGLAVCKSIVDLHRGSITVDSTPGRTLFTVRIPLESGEAPCTA